jgi:branched-chain amino acid transport system substrate-binding protein
MYPSSSVRLFATTVGALLLTCAARAEIVIGVAGPMSGQYASGGEQMKHGVEAAVAEINAKGGLLGQQLRVEVGDDACDPKQAVSVANTFVNKKVAMVVGHYCSSSTIPASEVYSEAEIPMITISTNEKVTDRGLKNVFRVTGRDDQEGKVAGDYIATKFAGKHIAIVDDKSAFGKGQADNVEKTLEQRKAHVSLRASITAGEKDYTALVSKLKASGADVVFYGGYFTELALILRQANQAGLKATFMGGNVMGASELATAAGPASNGVLFTFYPDPRKYPSSADVVKRFRANGVEPDGYVLFCYAAVQVYAQAVNQTKSLNPTAVEKALSAGSFNTVLGKESFDAKGDPRSPGFVVNEWNDGKYDVVQ